MLITAHSDEHQPMLSNACYSWKLCLLVMDVRSLRYFVAVADEGTVSGAASDMGITQPAMSRQLKQLENSTGLKLFARSGVKLMLTSEGRAFVHSAREVLQKMDHATQVAHQLASGRLTDVTIKAPRTTLIDVVAPFVATFRPEDPVPTISEITIDPDLPRLLPTTDMVVTTRQPVRDVDDVGHLPLAHLPVWAYVPRTHPWAGDTDVELNTLVTEQLLLPSRDFKARHLLESAMQLAGVAPRSVVETLHGRVAQALAAAGRGVAVLSDDPRFDLVPLRVHTRGSGLGVQLFATWRRDHHAAEALADLAGRLREFCRERYGDTVEGNTTVSDALG